MDVVKLPCHFINSFMLGHSIHPLQNASVWGVPLGITITLLTLLPIGIVMGVTGHAIMLNVLAQIIIGFLIPGDTIGVMAFASGSKHWP